MIKLNKKRIALIILGLSILFCLAIWIALAQPSFFKNIPVTISINTNKLKEHVKFLSVDAFPRHELAPDQMEKAAGYIESSFRSSGCEVERQAVPYHGKIFYNIIGRLNKGKGHKMVIGAHYDTHLHTPGADDNASGVAGLLELADLLSKANLSFEVELVAYTLEEIGCVGSVVHAKNLNQNNEKLDGVLVFEMIGYFSDKPNSQAFPLSFLYLIYPSKGNFIALVGIINQGSFTRTIKSGMQGSTDLPIYSLNAPSSLGDIHRSDHASYWPYGYSALMITDTADFRNEAYHQKEDTMDRLDFDRMGKVVLSAYNYLTTRKTSN